MMAGGMTVTEDTPPDMLAGSMDLAVVLPNGHSLKMSVERSTPMMDLLVQVTTANKISPAGYILKPLNERGPLPYKPSTPIGALDAWTINVVPKQLGHCPAIKKPLKLLNQPFEQTFRLQVHLPRNQLFVARVSPKTRLSDILLQVCSEKNLDPLKYSLRHPINLDQVLSLHYTLGDYKLQELTLVCNKTHPVEVSSVDIMSLQRETANPAYRNTKCEGSVSSGSLEGRSLSPVPSDESSASPPPLPLPPSRPLRKRRPAPKPPTIIQKPVINDKQVNGIQPSTVINHSRNSSDSSGYHEASVLSESPQNNSVPESRKVAAVGAEAPLTATLSQSMTDVSAIQSQPLHESTSCNSISSLTSATGSATGRKKKSAPPPPPVAKDGVSTVRSPSVSSTASSTTTLDGNEANVTVKSATLPPSTRLNKTLIPPPPPATPPPTPATPPVAVEPSTIPRGRFASSACRLIRQTKKRVGMNLNKFGNSFKFKKTSETPSDSESQECKFKKLVRKNAIKKNNINAPKYCEKNNNMKDFSVKSQSFMVHPKQVNINIDRKKIFASERSITTKYLSRTWEGGMKGMGVKVRNNLEGVDCNRNFADENNPPNLDFTNVDKTSNLKKYNEFFQCIEADSLNRNTISKSESFSDKNNVTISLPQKSHSFKVIPTNYNASIQPVLGNYSFCLKLEDYDKGNIHSSVFPSDNNITSKRSMVKCNLLAPPPPELLISRSESLESWNRFLHQLDDILLNREGEFV